MKKIGVITLQPSKNYGAVLQQFALQQFVLSLGFDVELINYSNPIYGSKKFSFWRKLKFIFFKHIIVPISTGNIRERRTKDFYRKHINVSKVVYKTPISLLSSLSIYDGFLVGSDQVWNPKIIGDDSNYFLNFAYDIKPTASYAASFGTSKIEARYEKKISEFLMNIDYLSVREFEGKQIVKSLTGRSSNVHIDPTLLLTTQMWLGVSSNKIKKDNYILCYYMPGDIIVNKLIKETALYISKKKGLSIINIGLKEYFNFKKNNFLTAGPSEFIELISKAKYVITNSFHGTALSIKFNKPFFVPVNNYLQNNNSLNSRVETLLKICNLKTRMYDNLETLDNIIDAVISYENVNELLKIKEKESKDFLLNFLKGI